MHYSNVCVGGDQHTTAVIHCTLITTHRAVVIRFGMVRLVVHTQECYTLGGPGGMLPQENVEIYGL